MHLGIAALRTKRSWSRPSSFAARMLSKRGIELQHCVVVDEMAQLQRCLSPQAVGRNGKLRWFVQPPSVREVALTSIDVSVMGERPHLTFGCSRRTRVDCTRRVKTECLTTPPEGYPCYWAHKALSGVLGLWHSV